MAVNSVRHGFLCNNKRIKDKGGGECCNTLSHEGLANVNIRKRMLYRHCYIPSLQAVPNNFIQLYAEMSTINS